MEETFLNVTAGGREEANGTWWVEARDVAQHPTVPRMVPNKENLAPDISSAEKPYITRN